MFEAVPEYKGDKLVGVQFVDPKNPQLEGMFALVSKSEIQEALKDVTPNGWRWYYSANVYYLRCAPTETQTLEQLFSVTKGRGHSCASLEVFVNRFFAMDADDEAKAFVQGIKGTFNGYMSGKL